jgi:dihydroceramide fatty acyl 2-hydroxylase
MPEPDLDAPLVAQAMAMSPRAYEEWVHTPVYGRVGRLFGTAWMEALTVTRWWAIPLLWGPIAAALMAGYLGSKDFSAIVAAATAGLALGLWSLTEYTLHRGMFHIDAQLGGGLPDHPWARGGHFLMHGCHHKLPDDGGRLVMAPALGLVLTFLLYGAVRVALYGALPIALFNFAMGVGILGYIGYDLTHCRRQARPAGSVVLLRPSCARTGCTGGWQPALPPLPTVVASTSLAGACANSTPPGPVRATVRH